MSRARAQDVLEDPALHRRQSSRQVRHAAKMHLQVMVRDEDALDDAVLPVGCHDLGRKTSPKPKEAPRHGREKGFKVWKTAFWKRRRHLWAERNAVERAIFSGE
jgi:hypothetical protein